MTDRRMAGGDDLGRLDLRSLDLPSDDRTDFVVDQVLTEILRQARTGTDIARILVRAQRGMAAAAIVLAALAATVLGIEPSRQQPLPASELVAVWAQSNHVPTNGELLTAYLGYQP